MKIHILNEDRNNSLCEKAVLDDRAITQEQALDGELYNCTGCHRIAFGIIDMPRRTDNE